MLFKSNSKINLTKEELDFVKEEFEKLKYQIKISKENQFLINIPYQNKKIRNIFLEIIAINLSNYFETKMYYDFEEKRYKETEEYLIVNDYINNVKDYNVNIKNEDLLVYSKFEEPLLFKSQKTLYRRGSKLKQEINAHIKTRNNIVLVNNVNKSVVFYSKGI